MHPLKIYLKQKKIKKKKFAKLMKISDRMLSYYISFEKYPSRSTAKKISELTGIPVIKLLYPEDDDA